MVKWFLVMCLSGVFSMAAGLELNTVRDLDPVPEDNDYFLQTPASFEMDGKGNYYVADWFARVIFVWNADGTFKETIGQPGKGPGEFAFMSQGGPQGYLGFADDTLHVYDGGKRSVLHFGMDGKFSHSVGLDTAGGRINAFYVTPKGQYIIYFNKFIAQTPTMEVTLLSGEGKPVKALKSIEDNTFDREGSGGQVSAIVIKGFASRFITNFDAARDELVLGYNDKPAFEVMSSDGGNVRQIRVALAQQDVTAEDRDEFNDMPWIKNNTFFKTSFPEKKPFYNRLLNVGGLGFLVLTESPHLHRFQGILAGPDGKTLGRIAFQCGENGTLLGARGKLLRVQTNEEGEFNLSEIRPVVPGGGVGQPGSPR